MATKDFTPLKECNKCRVMLPATLEYFYKHSRGKNGLYSHCKNCHLSMTRPNAKQWNKANPDKNAAAQRKYKEKYPLANTLRSHARRLSKTSEHSEFANAADVELMLKTQNGKCWYCQCSLNGKYHIDHFIPISKGGSLSVGNLRLTCQPCNSHKHNTLPWQWNGRLI
jgi:5-methylcytosine-specific restriction endonuclease McrA